MGGLGVLLLGTGVTAFGIAPLAPDASDLPVRQIVEALDAPTRLDIDSLVADSPAAPLVLYRSETTRRDDTAQSLLQRLGVVDTEAQGFLRTDATAALADCDREQRLSPGRPPTFVVYRMICADEDVQHRDADDIGNLRVALNALVRVFRLR